MFDFGIQPNGDRKVRELKVKLPADQITTLHGIKVVTGRPVSETVRIALAEHFERIRETEEARQLQQAVSR